MLLQKKKRVVLIRTFLQGVIQMSTSNYSLTVDKPVRDVYDQWTQFESFPRFMPNVERIEQLDNTHLHWQVNIAGVLREFDAEVTDQIPDSLVAWQATTGVDQSGVLEFNALDAEHTEVVLTLNFEPTGVVESVGDKLGFVEDRAEASLRNFKEYIENRPNAEDGWRGTVVEGEVQ